MDQIDKPKYLLAMQSLPWAEFRLRAKTATEINLNIIRQKILSKCNDAILTREFYRVQTSVLSKMGYYLANNKKALKVDRTIRSLINIIGIIDFFVPI